jgi:MtN3 and saliva related transmembrane protein
MFEFWMTLVGVSMAFGEVPQIIRIWRRKRSDDVSLVLWFVTLHGLIWWLIYGICKESTCLIIANTMCVILCISLIISIIKFRGNKNLTNEI